jgi:signal transduction histidine kinase
MSHELRTPLNAIIGFSEIIQDGLGSPGASHREYAADINHAGKHLLDLINDILDLSRADDGTLELRPEICEVSELINFGVDSIRNAAAMAGIDIALVNPAGMPRLYVDPRRVRQVLINILSNAVKFTPRDVHVSIAAVLEQDGRLSISVDDTGISMTEAQIKTAMAPFDQVDNRLSRRFEGVGLGLPLTQRLMSLHDGTLDIVSQKDRGTRVIVRFPAAESALPFPP